MKEKSLIAKIRRSLKKRETCIVPWGIWRTAIVGATGEMDFVDRVARKAGSDWLVDTETGEARFFEGPNHPAR